MKPEIPAFVPLDQIAREHPSDFELLSDEERMREELLADREIELGANVIIGLAIIVGLVKAGHWIVVVFG